MQELRVFTKNGAELIKVSNALTTDEVISFLAKTHPENNGYQVKVFEGDANWDIYRDSNDRLWSIPKPNNSAKASSFGDLRHIIRLINNGHFTDKPTEKGLEFMSGLHTRLFTDSKGKQFGVLRMA